MTYLDEFDLSRKILITMFLIVLSCGFGASHFYLHYTMGKASKEEHLVPTARDITLHFYGDRTSTRLKQMVLGKMKQYFSEHEDPKNLTAEEQADLDAVIDWNDRGAPEDEYWNPAKHSETRKISNILYQRTCFDCHSRQATQEEAKPDSPLDTFPGISRFVRPNMGMDLGRLLMLSHVHLLGMAMMFLCVGIALSFTRWPERFRTVVILAGFTSILLDIGGWWAVKFGGAAFAWTVMAGGFLLGAAFGMGVLASLAGMWRKNG